MLSQLFIRDLALIASLDLELESGLTVVTGETGAGKSILMDALSFGLGERADTNRVRPDCKQADVSLTFSVQPGSQAGRWLAAQELDAEGECVVRRTLSREGRSRGYINGRPVPMQSLQALGELLVDLHGQHAHQSLLRREEQRRLLDEFGGHQALLKKVAVSYRTWRDLQDNAQRLQADAGERAHRLELLRYQVQELEELACDAAEWQALNRERDRLANADRLLSTTGQALTRLYEQEEGSLHGEIAIAIRNLSVVGESDPAIAQICGMLEQARIQIEEAAFELRNFTDNLAPDPARLEQLEQQLAAIQALARKHHVAPEELGSLRASLSDEMRSLESRDSHRKSLETEITRAATQYRKRARQLSKCRAQAAAQLEKRVTDVIHQLGMPAGRFRIALEQVGEEHAGSSGLDRIEFQVSANPGQPLQSLARVASGGELSRISLAIHVITVRSGRIPTLIFDEADVGIGGGVAEIVGRLLRTLGDNRQVFCVTHLPQVAALGQQHLRVHKQQTRKATHTLIQALDEEKRIDEVARMLGGIDTTEEAINHARSILEQGRQSVPATP